MAKSKYEMNIANLQQPKDFIIEIIYKTQFHSCLYIYLTNEFQFAGAKIHNYKFGILNICVDH